MPRRTEGSDGHPNPSGRSSGLALAKHGLNPGSVCDKGVLTMKKSPVALVLALLVGLVSTSWAQPYPANGFIGVYEDAARTDCCINSNTGTPINFFIYAILGGGTSGGITGAEFRVDCPGLAGMFVNATANPASTVSLGNPLDDPANANDPGGVNIAFGTCQGAVEGFVLLYTVSGFNASVASADLTVRPRTSPSHPLFNSPLMVLCDAPEFTKVCLTITKEQNGGNDPIIYNSAIRPVGTACPAIVTCQAVSVAPATWSGIKDMYR